MTMNDNPFKAPAAHVADAGGHAGDFLPDGQRVPAGNGINWLGRGWDLFRQAPGVWIGIGLIYLIISMVLVFIPILGPLALSLLAPVFFGGIMLGCHALSNNEELSIGHLFAGFSNHAGNLILVGVVYLVGVIAIMIVAGIGGAILGVGAFALGMSSMALIPMLMLSLLSMLLLIPLAMAVWFAPALVVFHEVPPFDAMKGSFFACLKNFLPFLLYGIAVFILAIIASIPFGLGWLVLIPILMASMYASYRDMFTRS